MGTDGYRCVRIDAYGCTGVQERGNETRMDTGGEDIHDLGVRMDGKFPDIMSWVYCATKQENKQKNIQEVNHTPEAWPKKRKHKKNTKKKQ